jgi:hypothetical protein
MLSSTGVTSGTKDIGVAVLHNTISGRDSSYRCLQYFIGSHDTPTILRRFLYFTRIPLTYRPRYCVPSVNLHLFSVLSLNSSPNMNLAVWCNNVGAEYFSIGCFDQANESYQMALRAICNNLNARDKSPLSTREARRHPSNPRK